ncbi:MAG: hypothetical protein RI920_2280 [Pseudomonadota bacterium]
MAAWAPDLSVFLPPASCIVHRASCKGPVRNLLAEAKLAFMPKLDGRTLSCSCQTVAHEQRAPVGIETGGSLRRFLVP